MIDRMFYALARLQKKLVLAAVKNCSLHKTATHEGGCQIADSTMGRYSYCGYDCHIHNAEIGAFCSISDHVYIGGMPHPLEYVSTSPVFLRNDVRSRFANHPKPQVARTRIGNDVWIGHGAKIRAGVSVGDGAVIGMGAVVTKDVEPYWVVGGSPARPIRRRFDDATVEVLIASKWWDASDAELKRIAKYFDDPTAFVAFLSSGAMDILKAS